jgi:carbon monoxide dehydrogenase subunit G
MVVRVERVVEVPGSCEQVWSFISDPAKRAGAISVVERFEVHDDGHATWYVTLPIPLVDRKVAFETRERQRDPPRYVEFTGSSKVAHIVGEHELEELADGTRLTNRFVVDGKLPGVERFFSRNLGDELDNLEAAIRADLEDTDP